MQSYLNLKSPACGLMNIPVEKLLEAYALVHK